MNETLEEDDIRDALLFRFWIRAANDFPGETMVAIRPCITPDQYRVALRRLALSKGINLP